MSLRLNNRPDISNHISCAYKIILVRADLNHTTGGILS